MSKIIKFGFICSGIVALLLCAYLLIPGGFKKNPIRHPGPNGPFVNIDFSQVVVAKDQNHAVSLSKKEIVVPAGSIIRIKGSFLTGERKGNALILAEIKMSGRDGVLAMSGNGATGVSMKPNSECNFELSAVQPKAVVGSGVLEIRLGDEFLATVPLVTPK